MLGISLQNTGFGKYRIFCIQMSEIVFSEKH